MGRSMGIGGGLFAVSGWVWLAFLGMVAGLGDDYQRPVAKGQQRISPTIRLAVDYVNHRRRRLMPWLL